MATVALPLLEGPRLQEQRIAMTFEEFLALPENLHAEWVDGEAIIFKSTTALHARVITFLVRLVGGFAEELGLGEVLTAPYGMRVRSGRPFREPDVMFVSAVHRDRVVGIAVEVPADLVIEVVSDDSVTRDRTEKFEEYQETGVSEYWIYDPRPGQERVDAYHLGDAGRFEPIAPDAEGRLRSVVLPGFWLRLDWLQADPLPSVRAVLAEILAELPRTGSATD